MGREWSGSYCSPSKHEDLLSFMLGEASETKSTEKANWNLKEVMEIYEIFQKDVEEVLGGDIAGFEELNGACEAASIQLSFIW